MDYPSTTQALFALIVMIIVLAFILVYCCWGTFSCPQRDDFANTLETASDGQIRRGRESPGTPALVILPYHSMIYIGDGQTQQVFQIPFREDKPPSYKDIFASFSLPPTNNRSSTITESEPPPPTYEECVQYGEEISNMLEGRSSHSSNSLNAIKGSGMQKGVIFPTQHLLNRSHPNVFRAGSLLTVIPSNLSTLSSISHSSSCRTLPTIPILNSSLPAVSLNIQPQSKTSLPQRATAFTSTSNPCLPANDIS